MTPLPLWRTAFFNLSYALWSLALGIVCMPLMLVPSRTPAITYVWAVGTLFLLKHICNITYTVRGMEHFTAQDVLVASKHQSAMDIVVLSHLFYKSAFVLKRELTWIPIVGWLFPRMGMIAVNRKKGRESLAPMIAEARARLQERRVVVIFPEGTRMKAGERGRWNPGVGMMYDELKVPMLPVALNTGCFWPRNKWTKASGVAVVEFLPIIPAGLSIRASVKQLEEQIETKSQTLFEETHAPK
jgi:1-acyl-sn-glycerol-3-phosphate acyltransferase